MHAAIEANSDYEEKSSVANFVASFSEGSAFEESLGETNSGIRVFPSLDIDDNIDVRRLAERTFKSRPLTAIFDSPNTHRCCGEFGNHDNFDDDPGEIEAAHDADDMFA
jgi:hypothetical protein